MAPDDAVPPQFADVLRPPTLQAVVLPGDGTYPNNDDLPVLVYEGALRPGEAPAQRWEEVFRAHDWRGAWRNGIFPYHHYHTTTHEVLGVARGTARVQLGGPEGVEQEVSAGDALVLPAGVAHKNRGADADFLVVGAYPEGRSWDLKTGEPGDRRAIAAVPRPTQDPVYGPDGPLLEHWGASGEE